MCQHLYVFLIATRTTSIHVFVISSPFGSLFFLLYRYNLLSYKNLLRNKQSSNTLLHPTNGLCLVYRLLRIVYFWYSFWITTYKYQFKLRLNFPHFFRPAWLYLIDPRNKQYKQSRYRLQTNASHWKTRGLGSFFYFLCAPSNSRFSSFEQCANAVSICCVFLHSVHTALIRHKRHLGATRYLSKNFWSVNFSLWSMAIASADRHLPCGQLDLDSWRVFRTPLSTGPISNRRFVPVPLQHSEELLIGSRSSGLSSAFFFFFLLIRRTNLWLQYR